MQVINQITTDGKYQVGDSISDRVRRYKNADGELKDLSVKSLHINSTTVSSLAGLGRKKN